MRIAAGDAELVVGSCLAETDELKSRIGIEVNEAAVGRARRNAAEDADAPVIAFGNASGSPRSIAPQLRRPRPTAPSFQPGPRGGVLLTKKAMKDTPVAETRVERVKRADSPPAPAQPVETVEAKAMPAPPPPAEPAAPAAGPEPPVQASTEPPKIETPKPIAEGPKPAEPARAAESTPRTEPARPAEQLTKSAEQKEAEVRKAEQRKIERQKRDAERRAKAMAMAKAKQRQFEEQPEPSRPEYVFERSSRNALAFEREERRFNPEERRFNPFDIPLFGRSHEFSPIDSED
jgi:hypothetical protein